MPPYALSKSYSQFINMCNDPKELNFFDVIPLKCFIKALNDELNQKNAHVKNMTGEDLVMRSKPGKPDGKTSFQTLRQNCTLSINSFIEHCSVVSTVNSYYEKLDELYDNLQRHLTAYYEATKKVETTGVLMSKRQTPQGRATLIPPLMTWMNNSYNQIKNQTKDLEFRISTNPQKKYSRQGGMPSIS